MRFSCIVAMDEERGIGKQGKIPWRFPDDIRHFAEVTTGIPTAGKQNAVIMGRRTWESLPERFRPLPKRLNVVLSRSAELPVPQGVVVQSSLTGALAMLSDRKDVHDVFVIGGAAVFAEAVQHPSCSKLLITSIPGTYECDVFFPDLSVEFGFVNVMGVIGYPKNPSFALFERDLSSDG